MPQRQREKRMKLMNKKDFIGYNGQTLVKKQNQVAIQLIMTPINGQQVVMLSLPSHFY